MSQTELATKALHERLIRRIVGIVLSFVVPRRILLFGSRVRGSARRYSDFDIAIEGIRLDIRTRRRLAEELDRRMGPYTVDLVELDAVDEPFSGLVLDEGEVIYERPPNGGSDQV